MGNLTVGGTGKTPLVAWIARWFRQQGIRVTLLSRGYGAGEGGVNDEALELEQRIPDVPHLQNPDRVQSARTAIEELDAQLLLMDDGFQHRRLRRNLDIVLIDCTEPFGHGHLLPRGKLRESIRGLSRANMVILTRAGAVSDDRRAEIVDRVKRYCAAPIAVIDQQPEHLLAANGDTCGVDSFANRPVAAFCGIGNPTGFRHTLRKAAWMWQTLSSFLIIIAMIDKTFRQS